MYIMYMCTIIVTDQFCIGLNKYTILCMYAMSLARLFAWQHREKSWNQFTCTIHMSMYAWSEENIYIHVHSRDIILTVVDITEELFPADTALLFRVSIVLTQSCELGISQVRLAQ